MLDLEKVFILQPTSGPGSKTSLLLGLRAWEPQCFDCLTRSKFEKAKDQLWNVTYNTVGNVVANRGILAPPPKAAGAFASCRCQRCAVTCTGAAAPWESGIVCIRKLRLCYKAISSGTSARFRLEKQNISLKTHNLNFLGVISPIFFEGLKPCILPWGCWGPKLYICLHCW